MMDIRGDCMWKAIRLMIGIGLLSIIAFWIYDWIKTDKLSEEVSIEKDSAESLDVEIDFAVGKLVIGAGTTKWVEGKIDTKVKKWYPSVNYKNKKDVGYVTIQQQKKRFWTSGRQRNNWDLQLTNEIPVNLDVDIGVSDADLNLSGLRISHLSVDAGVGDTMIDLSGDWEQSFDADINLGVGDATIHLPKDVGVKLSVSKGIGKVKADGFISEGDGSYVNEAYESSDTKIHLDVDVGIGQVKFLLVE